MKVNKKKWFELFAQMGWAGAGLLFFMGTNAAVKSEHMENIHEVEYHLNSLEDGNDLITVDEIRKRVLSSYKKGLKGLAISQLDLSDLEELLRRESFITKADAYIDANHILHIVIIQRKPLVRVMGLDGSNYYLDENGIKLPLSRHFTARVPVISGSVSEYRSDFQNNPGTLRAAYNLIQAAREDDFMNHWLDGIYVTSNREMWLTGTVGDFKVIFGDDQHIGEKIFKMKKFFQKGLKITGWKNIDSINLMYDKQVIVKSQTKA